MLAIQPDIKTSSNLEGEVIEMGLDQSAMGQAHLASVLSNMYSKPRTAVLREYSTNAWDAHLYDGVTRPLEVTLPTSLDPVLTIRDYGRGLDVDAIRRIYSRYGTSESRESETATGALGLGSKSALTYADSFVVVSVKDGKRIQVSVSKTAAMPTMTLMEDEHGRTEVPTDEPSGTTIMVPTQRYDYFTHEATRLFKYWPEGSVLLNGATPSRFEADLVAEDILAEHANGDVYIIESLHVSQSETSYVVMGNVAYPIDTEHMPDLGLKNGKGVIAFVEVGSIEFAPSREALMYTAFTKRALANIGEAFVTAIREAIQRDIDAQTTRWDAVTAMLKWRKTMGKLPDGLNYKGVEVPMDLAVNCRVTRHSSSKLASSSAETRLNIETFQGARFFNYWTHPSLSAAQKKKLKQYCDEQGLAHPEYYVLLPSTLSPEAKSWINPAQIHPWSEVQKVRLPRNYNGGGGGGGGTTGSTGRIPGSYDCYIGGVFHWGYDPNEIDQDCPIFYEVAKTDEVSDEVDYLNLAYGDEYTFVVLTSNRVDKFKRSFPQAVKVNEQAKIDAPAWEAQQSKADLKAVIRQNDLSYGLSVLKRMDATRVRCPKIRKSVRMATKDVSEVARARNIYMRVAPYALKVREADSIPNPFADYPLWDSTNFRYHEDHMYLYLNAAYKAGKDN